MPLVNTDAMLKKAQKCGYAVGHFNTSNLEITQAIREAAAECNAPVIIGASKSAVEYAGFPLLVQLAKHALDRPNTKKQKDPPYALHLDHGPTSQLDKDAVKAGFTSVMIDASSMDYAHNVRETRKVVQFAKRYKVSVEAEIGVLKGIEDYVKAKEHILTDPKKAVQFVKDTKVNSLAIAIGTSHGAQKFSGKAHLDLKRLEEIRDEVSVPLVLHGASSVYQDIVKGANTFGARLKKAHGVPDSILKKCIRRGITKINTDTDLRLAFLYGTRRFLKKNPEVFDYRKIIGAGKDEVRKMVIRKIKVLGSKDMA